MAKIEIANKIFIRDAPYDVLDPLVEYLTVENPKYIEALKLGRSTWGIPELIYNFDQIYNGIAIPRGCRKKLLSTIEEKGTKDVEIIDNRATFDHIEIDSSNIKFRPYQFKPVHDLITKADEGVLVAPAGSGKTVIGISLIPILGQPCLWLTHTNRLAQQVVDRLVSFLPSIERDNIGVIGGGKWKIGDVFTVGMIQTLSRNIEKLGLLRGRFGLVIIDEAHHCPAATFLVVVKELDPYYLYGLTATPYRRDKLETVMFQVIGEATAVITTEEVEKHGGIIIPTVKYRTLRSKSVDDNNTPRILKKHIIWNKRRNNIIVGDVIREAIAGHYCIVVSDRKVHCETLFDLISVAWEKTGIATGNYSRKYQDEQVERFYSNEITVLVTTFELLGEGFDVDFLDRAFLATPFRSETKIEQITGRIQRVAPGKIDSILHDYVDYDIGVLRDQFESPNKNKDSRCRAYERLRMQVEPYEVGGY